MNTEIYYGKDFEQLPNWQPGTSLEHRVMIAQEIIGRRTWYGLALPAYEQLNDLLETEMEGLSIKSRIFSGKKAQQEAWASNTHKVYQSIFSHGSDVLLRNRLEFYDKPTESFSRAILRLRLDREVLERYAEDHGQNYHGLENACRGHIEKTLVRGYRSPGHIQQEDFLRAERRAA